MLGINTVVGDVDIVGAVPLLLDIPSTPLEEPVLVFAIAMFGFLVAPLAIERLGQPGIVGIILFGALLGPGGLGLVGHVGAIELLGTVGLVYLLFTVGLDLDLRGLKENPEAAASFGLLSFFIPFIVGIFAGTELLGLDFWAAFLLSAVFSSHTLLAYPIVNQYGVSGNDAVTAVFGGILFTDTLALIMLAVATGAASGGISASLFLFIGISILILFGGVWLIVPPIAKWFFRTFSQESYFEFLFVMTVVFAAAGLAEILELAAILGAFIVGLALNDLIPDGGPLRNRISFVGNAFLIPFFLIHVGMLVDFSILFEGTYTLIAAGVILVVMFSMKAVAAGVFGYANGYDMNVVGTVYGLSIGQAAAALAITLVGIDAGLFGEEILNAVVLMLLVSAVASPLVTKIFAGRLAESGEVGESGDEIADPSILLPLSHYADLQRRLLELSFLFKESGSTDPVHTLTVVRPGDDSEQTVKEIREDKDDLTEVGNEAEIQVDTETRVNRNIPSGIVRGSVEVEADMILMGWEATEPSFGQRIFGTVIDRVLERTRLPVMIARLGHPVNITERIHIILPEGIDHHEGFFESLHFVKKMADKIGVDVSVLAVGGSDHQYERLYELVDPEVSAEFKSFDTWEELHNHLDVDAGKDDLVTAITPRRGDARWNDTVKDLPPKLAGHPPESFVIFHPRKGDPQYDRRYLRIE